MGTATLVVHDLLTWRALLDIVIMTAGLFFLYRTVVRLGTWKIVAGILVAFLVFLVARLLRLEGVGWIFQNVSQVAVLALIVIFQPELRKILEKVVSLYGSPAMSADAAIASMVAASLSRLAGQKRGAIIVFPGKEPVAEFLAGGHRLDGEASEALIMSIFDPNSPGHDGAVIIQHNKLSRFGVRLPMSRTTRLAEDYGTRHHAAMGLAETTDALVLVVSEERGVVSAFVNGSMTVMKDAETIVARIREHQADHGLFERSALIPRDRRTVVQLALCLVVAGTFWATLAAASKQIVERTFTLPVVYSQPAEDLIIVGDQPEEAKVRVAGPRAAIDDFLLGQPTVKIDLAKMVAGTQTVLISHDNLGADGSITFLASDPAQVEIKLAPIVRKSIPVIPQLVGSLPANLKLSKVTVVPDMVEVMAPPAQRGDKPLSVSTTPVYLNSIHGPSRIFCKIIAPPAIQPAGRPWQDVEVVLEVTAAR